MGRLVSNPKSASNAAAVSAGTKELTNTGVKLKEPPAFGISKLCGTAPAVKAIGRRMRLRPPQRPRPADRPTAGAGKRPAPSVRYYSVRLP